MCGMETKYGKQTKATASKQETLASRLTNVCIKNKPQGERSYDLDIEDDLNTIIGNNDQGSTDTTKQFWDHTLCTYL